MELTDEQNEAQNFLHRFLNGPHRMGCLQGYAGVGKTTVIGHWLRQVGLRLCVAAPTHQALMVLKSKLGEDFEYHTLSALFGERPSFNDHGEEQFAPEVDTNIRTFALIVVDECSMVTKQDFERLRTWTDGKVLFVGDPAQLPPVKEGTSPSFTVTETFRMTNIVRQAADNPIIGMSKIVRNRMGEAGFVILQDLQQGLTRDNRYTIQARSELHAFAISAHQHNLYAPILAWDNESVITHNHTIHAHLYPDAPLFGEGEYALSYDTRYGSSGIVLYNGERTRVVRCVQLEQDSFPIDVYRVTLQRDSGQKVDVTVAGSELELNNLRGRIKRALRELPFNAYADRHDLIEDLKVLQKQFTKVRHSYAMTVHKSQGSTFDVALVDWRSIARARKEAARMLYTAVTRPRDYLVVAV